MCGEISHKKLLKTSSTTKMYVKGNISHDRTPKTKPRESDASLSLGFVFGVLSWDIFPFTYIFVVEDVLRSFLCDISPHNTYLHHILPLSQIAARRLCLILVYYLSRILWCKNYMIFLLQTILLCCISSLAHSGIPCLPTSSPIHHTSSVRAKL